MTDQQHWTDEELAADLKQFHMSDPAIEDPYPFMAELRSRCPVGRSEATGGYWVLTRYEDIHSALKDPSTFSSCVIAVPEIEGERGKLIPINYDPPEHTLYRNEFAGYFSPPVVARTEPAARVRIAELIDAFVAKGGGDFIDDVADPFPCITFLSLLGLPLEDLPRLSGWKDVLIHELLTGIPERIQHVVTVVLPQIEAYFRDAIETRAAMTDQPEDVLTFLCHAKQGDRPFELVEKVQTLMLFFQAGLDTVTGQLGFILEFLATHPEHRRQLVDEPELIPNAVEEFLRYFSIVTLARKVVKPAVVSGVEIPAGDLVVFLTQSAGRDEEQYQDSDTVDFRRKPIRHLGFGGGPHRCVGSHLARMELIVALQEVVRRMPNFELDPIKPVTRHFGAVAGLDHLSLIVPRPS